MSNSPLVSYTKLSPNHSGLRTHKIDTITPHCVVGHLSLQSIGNIFSRPAKKSSSNYAIDDRGRVGMYVEEKNRSWASSSEKNDQRSVTVEIACDLKPPYKITEDALRGFIKLCVDICQRNDIPELLWKADKNLIGHVDQQNMTIHRWFKPTNCPGEYILGQLGYVAAEVNKILKPVHIPDTTPNKPLNTDALPYTVSVNIASLHYRKGPGTNHPVVGTIHKGQVYTIVAVAYGVGSSKWGKLKSGAGWIALDYCTRLR